MKKINIITYKKPIIKEINSNKLISLYKKKDEINFINLTNNDLIAVICGTCCYGCSDIGVSDKRVKKNIKEIKFNKILEKISKIKIYKYKWQNIKNLKIKNLLTKNRNYIGFITQNIEKEFPEIIYEYKKIKHIYILGMMAILLEAVKEIKKELDLISNKIHI